MGSRVDGCFLLTLGAICWLGGACGGDGLADGGGGALSDEDKIRAIASARAPSPAAVPALTPGSGILETIRINFGSDQAYRDSQGRDWRPDPFPDGGATGTTVDRGDRRIAATKNQRLYQTERYGMSELEIPATNGFYVVLLHFAETYMDGPGKRVFDVDVPKKWCHPFFSCPKIGHGVTTRVRKSDTTTA